MKQRKVVNVYPKAPLTMFNPPIVSAVKNTRMTNEEIRAALMGRAMVEEVLPDGTIVNLDITNYDKSNADSQMEAEIKKAEEAKRRAERDKISPMQAAVPVEPPKKEEPPKAEEPAEESVDDSEPKDGVVELDNANEAPALPSVGASAETSAEEEKVDEKPAEQPKQQPQVKHLTKAERRAARRAEAEKQAKTNEDNGTLAEG